MPALHESQTMKVGVLSRLLIALLDADLAYHTNTDPATQGLLEAQETLTLMLAGDSDIFGVARGIAQGGNPVPLTDKHRQDAARWLAAAAERRGETDHDHTDHDHSGTHGECSTCGGDY